MFYPSNDLLYGEVQNRHVWKLQHIRFKSTLSLDAKLFPRDPDPTSVILLMWQNKKRSHYNYSES